MSNAAVFKLIVPAGDVKDFFKFAERSEGSRLYGGGPDG